VCRFERRKRVTPNKKKRERRVERVSTMKEEGLGFRRRRGMLHKFSASGVQV